MTTQYTVTLTAATSAELDAKVLELASRLTDLETIATSDKKEAQALIAPSQPPVLQVPPVPSITPTSPPAPPIAPPPQPPLPSQNNAAVSTGKHTKKEVTDMGRNIMAMGENETKGVKDILKKHSVTGITTIPMELVETMFEEFTNLQNQINDYNAGTNLQSQIDGQNVGTQAPPAATPPASPPAPPVAAPPVPQTPQPPTIVPPAPLVVDNVVMEVSPPGTATYPRLLEIAQKASAMGGADVKDDIMGIVTQTGVAGLSEVSPEWFDWVEFHLVELYNRLKSQKG